MFAMNIKEYLRLERLFWGKKQDILGCHLGLFYSLC